ncbi:MAG: ABC transporter permease subunit [Proteobacteria bacterium]|jgi:multiple sugar transport system permease protein|nr:ABC transporter permease subunit [Pseudomonadota bacterium]HAH16300.1 sugar ABC transporter permease [Chloroflexota bacterium]NBQ61687.1 ABC transporter permease subunit [Pseudomonadota bacterium]NBT03400.1 ABC transporter permease subunit [Pseudomonadota bacterium]NBT19581.1 ABC transporter permease subunit [Pseudomonadota bacterium]
MAVLIEPDPVLPGTRTSGVRRPGGLPVLMRRVFGEDWATGYVFAAPMLLLLGGLIAWPLIEASRMSFYNVIGDRWGDFVGLGNYQTQIEDPIFRRSFWLTLQFTTEAVLVKFFIGLATALALHNVKRFSGILTALILAPYIVPEVVTAATFRLMYNPQFGALNLTIGAIYDLIGGAPVWGPAFKGIPWLGDANLALHAMVAVNVWKGVPFFVLLSLAGLKSLDAELYDAAAVDGANAWQRFLHITLPGLRYVIIVETLFSTVSTFNTFGLVYLITGGGPGGATRLYAVRAYELIGTLRYGQAVAVALLVAPLLGLAVIVLGHFIRAGQRGGQEHESSIYKAVLFVVWPAKMIIRFAVSVFWAINEIVEASFGLVSRVLFPAASPVALRSQRRVSRALSAIGIGLTILIVTFIELYPFYWIIITSFKSVLQFQKFESIFWPSPWTFVHYQEIFTNTAQFPLWLWNTVRVAVVSMAISLIASALGAYALVRLRWRGAGFVSTAILLTYLMPGIMLVVPLYQIFSSLQLTNSLGSLMVAYPTFLLPFACWLLMGYYRSIPEELEEAALIDGCNRFQAYFRIVLPLVLPALMAVALFALTNAWNEFLFAFVFIQSNSGTTLPVGLGRWIIGDVFRWGPIMAASVAMSVPVVAFYAMAQRFLVEGLTAGSVKG